jgi:hypothetical protein
MSDILERLQYMFFRFGRESPDDAANRRIQTAKDAATEIEKLRAALKEVLASMPVFPAPAKHIVGMADQYNDAITKARAALGETQ